MTATAKKNKEEVKSDSSSANIEPKMVARQGRKQAPRSSSSSSSSVLPVSVKLRAKSKLPTPPPPSWQKDQSQGVPSGSSSSESSPPELELKARGGHVSSRRNRKGVLVNSSWDSSLGCGRRHIVTESLTLSEYTYRRPE